MPYRRLGSSDRLSTSVKDVNGNLADPGDIFLDILDPTNVETTYDYNPGPIVRDGTGLFHYDVANLTALGNYAWLYRTTGNVQGIADPRYFTLVGKWTPILLTLAEAKSQVNASMPDADLELYVDSATETVEALYGPVIPRTVTKTAAILSDGRLMLPTRIVPGTITAATQNGVSVSITGWISEDTKVNIGFITTGTTRLYGTVTVTYTAGFNPIPTPLKESSALRVQHSYETQRGPAELPLAEEVTGGPSTFTLLLRARELERPYALSAVA